MTRKALLLITSALISMPATIANAETRYSAPPAITLSPDLTSPWVLQLKKKQAERRTTTVRTYQAKPVAKRKKKSWQWNVPKHNQRPPTGIFAAFGAKPQSQGQPYKRKQKKLAYSRLATPAPQVSNAQAQAYIQQTAAQRPLDPQFLPRTVSYQTSQKPGTIIIDTRTRHLYLITGDGKARRYGVGVGKQGFEWSGTEKITRKATWPSWTPPKEMIARERAKGRELPPFMEGGPANPLGARAIYLGSTLYRIHGTNQPWSIGQAVSSGCIRMRNEDVMDLYERIRIGAKVIVS